MPYLPRMRNTSSSWGVRIILADLYDWHEPITENNWPRLDAIVREKAHHRAAHHAILDRAKPWPTATKPVGRNATSMRPM